MKLKAEELKEGCIYSVSWFKPHDLIQIITNKEKIIKYIYIDIDPKAIFVCTHEQFDDTFISVNEHIPVQSNNHQITRVQILNILHSLPGFRDIWQRARELDEKDFGTWWWATSFGNKTLYKEIEK